MTSKIAKCKNCGFEQKGIFVCNYGGSYFHLKYACFKCKKIIPHQGDLKKCPDCKSEVTLYKGFNRNGYYTCPSCGKRKLKFYTETIS